MVRLDGIADLISSSKMQVDGEVEIDVDTMDTATMREVERYVIKECNPALYKALYLTGRSASEFIGDTPSVRRKKAKVRYSLFPKPDQCLCRPRLNG
jgi:hypothetical protein